MKPNTAEFGLMATIEEKISQIRGSSYTWIRISVPVYPVDASTNAKSHDFHLLWRRRSRDENVVAR